MSKLPHLQTTIFTVMSKMAVDFNAINLSQGFPNFPIDEKMVEIIKRLAGSDVHQYMPTAGYPPLMEKISKLTAQSYQRAINPLTELLITAGATEAIFATDASNISFLHALFYIKSNTNFDFLMNVNKGAQQDRIKGGAQSICIKLALEELLILKSQKLHM